MQHSKVIPFQGAQIGVDVVADRYIFDSEAFDAGATLNNQEFFVSKAGKSYAQANFEGDYTLVPEGRIFEVLGISVYVYQAATESVFADAKQIFDLGYYEFKISQTTTDLDWLHRLIGGVDLFDSAGVETPLQGDAAHANIRKYAVSRMVPGGRSIGFQLYWPGGITITAAAKIFVSFYGNELIPNGQVVG